MQSDTAHHLHVEMTHTHHPGGGFAHHRKGFRQQFIQGLAVLERLTEFTGLELQVRFAELCQRFPVAVDRFDQLGHAFQLTIILGADDFFYDGTQHTTSGSVKSQDK